VKKISVLFSFYNEEHVLKELLHRTRTTLIEDMELKSNEYEILLVNDSSRDRSLEILVQELDQMQDIRIINMSRNYGNAECILVGFEQSHSEYLAYLDSDLQDPPELIKTLYEKAQREELDIVHTVRSKRLGHSLLRKVITRLGYAFLCNLMDYPLDPESGDYKLLSRRAVKSILIQKREPFPFIRGMVASIGLRQGYIQYIRQPRKGGETHFPILSWRVARNLALNAIVGHSNVPIYVIFVFGCSFFLLTGIFLPLSLYLKKISILNSFFIFLASVHFLFFGIVALYLLRIKESTSHRSQPLIDTIIDSKGKVKGVHSL
jgi:glycosyltransferase involved in cell wall biosynthesis